MTIRTRSVDIPVSIDHQFSAGFFDFVQACMDSSSDIETLLNVRARSTSSNNSGRQAVPNTSQHSFLNSVAESVVPVMYHTACTSLLGHRLQKFGAIEARQKQVIEAAKYVMEMGAEEADVESGSSVSGQSVEL